jgi:hypothetical protein
MTADVGYVGSTLFQSKRALFFKIPLTLHSLHNTERSEVSVRPN